MQVDSVEENKAKRLTKKGRTPLRLLSATPIKGSIILQYAAFAALLFSVKLWLIGSYGNVTPFWDQWDSEAELLYKPFLNGTLKWSDLFAPHNEHRIFTTRLLALTLLYINKVWNPLLQMIVNAGLHVGMLMFGILLTARVVGRGYLPALFAFSFVLFGVPYGWENTLAGFQSQFYFVLLFSVASLWLTVTKEPLSSKWWLGVFSAILAFFSLASGVFALAAATFIHLVVYLLGLRRNYKQLLSIAVLAVLFLLGTWFTPSLEYHATLKANSVGQFYEALTTVLGWPISSGFTAAFFRNLPALLFVVLLFWKRPKANSASWFLAALVVWALGQAVSIAYGRATVALSSRYLDLFALGILVNFACLIAIAQEYAKSRRVWAFAGVGAWVTIVLVSLGWNSGERLPAELEAKYKTSLEQEANTRNYLLTGDYSYLKDKPLLSIPYPHADRLASILGSKEIRTILPASIGQQIRQVAAVGKPANAFVPNGYYPTTPNRTGNVYGSYNVQGDGGEGQMSIKLYTEISGGVLEVPVAGYPLREGMKLEIEQHGQRRLLPIEADPKESWGIAQAKVDKGEFTLYLTDANATTWLAVGSPVVITPLDNLTNKVLSHYYLLMFLGFALTIFLMIQKVMVQRPDDQLQ